MRVTTHLASVDLVRSVLAVWRRHATMLHSIVVWHLLGWRCLLWDLLLSSRLLTTRCRRPLRAVATGVFSWNYIDEEIKHVALCKRSRNVAPLQGPPLVVFCVNPGAHCQFGDEDVAAFREEDWCFGRNHLDFWIGFHDLLDTCEWQLMDLEIMVIGLEVVYRLLPIGRQDLSRLTSQALIYLQKESVISAQI